MPGPACGVPGRGKWRAVHAAARADRHRCAEEPTDWKVVDNPLRIRTNIRPDCFAASPQARCRAVPFADGRRDGNVWIGRQRELMTWRMRRENHRHGENFLRQSVRRQDSGRRHPPRILVESIAVADAAAGDAAAQHYAWDAEHLKEYAQLAATEEDSKVSRSICV